jgi:hypothetical protein
MASRGLPSHVHGQRISYADLVREAREQLATHGVRNNLRAELISKLAAVVVKDDRPLLAQQRPDVCSI